MFQASDLYQGSVRHHGRTKRLSGVARFLGLHLLHPTFSFLLIFSGLLFKACLTRNRIEKFYTNITLRCEGYPASSVECVEAGIMNIKNVVSCLRGFSAQP